jgi:dienelactone hydrolase
VLVGVSMGAGVVSELWCERPETAAVVLLHGYAVIPACVRPGVRATLHVAVGDRFAPEETISRWQQDAASRGVDAEVYRYPSPGHFFTDRASEDYDERAAQTLLARVRAFLQPAGTAPPIA